MPAQSRPNVLPKEIFIKTGDAFPDNACTENKNEAPRQLFMSIWTLYEYPD